MHSRLLFRRIEHPLHQSSILIPVNRPGHSVGFVLTRNGYLTGWEISAGRPSARPLFQVPNSFKTPFV